MPFCTRDNIANQDQ